MSGKMIIDVAEYVRSKGYQVAGIKGSTLIGKDQEGNTFEVDPLEILKTEGLSLKDFDIALNTPDTALEESPLEFTDRMKNALGNERGIVKAMQERFDAVEIHPENGIVVKDGGVWKALDPKSVGGDQWTLSNVAAKLLEGATDVAEFGASEALPMAGQIAGGAVGASAGPAGAVVGAGAGGAAGRLGTIALGKIVGTYEAPPEEIAKDLALEGVLSLGGEAVALGAKATISGVRHAFKNVGKNAADGTKDIITQVYGRTLGTQPQIVRTWMDNTDESFKEFTRIAAKSGKNLDEADLLVKQEHISDMKEMYMRASAELPNKFRAALEDTMQDAGAKKLHVNIGGMIDQAKKEIADAGFGKFVKGRFVPLQSQDIGRLMQQGGDTITDDAFVQVAKVVRELDKFKAAGSVRGPQAVKALANVHKNINALRSNLGADTPASVLRAIDIANQSFKNQTAKGMEAVGLADKWAKGADLYAKYANAVNEGRRALNASNPDKAVEILTNQLLSTSTKRTTAETNSRLIIDLLGEPGKAIEHRIRIREAGKHIMKIAPNAGLFQLQAAGVTAGAGITTALFGAPLAGIPAAAVAATQFSPRVVAKQIRMGKGMLGGLGKVNEFIKGLPPEQVKALLQNPEMMGAMYKEIFQATETGEKVESALLQQAGGGASDAQ